MSDGLIDLINVAKQVLSDIQSGKIAQRCVAELKSFLEPKIKQCVADAVDTWRGTYTPKYYSPTGGLKNMYKMKLTTKSFSISYGAEYATTGYRSPQSVEKIVFQEGYHGGYWRVPLNIWKYRSPRPTVKGPSILDLAEKNIDIIWNSEVVPKMQEISDNAFSSYGF